MCSCRSLRFDDKPDYAYLRRIMRELFYRKGYQSDFVFDWTIMNYQQDFSRQTQLQQQQTGAQAAMQGGTGNALMTQQQIQAAASGGKEGKDNGDPADKAAQERRERQEEKGARLKPDTASVAVTSHLGPGTINTGLGLLSASIASPIASPSSNMATPGYTPQGSPHLSSLSPSPVNGANPSHSFNNALLMSPAQGGLPGGQQQPSASSGSNSLNPLNTSSSSFQRRSNPRRSKPDMVPASSSPTGLYPPSSSPPPLPHIDQQTMDAFSRLTTRPEPSPPSASSAPFPRSASGGQVSAGGPLPGSGAGAAGSGAASPIYGTRISKMNAPLAMGGAAALQGPSSGKQQSSSSGGGRGSREQ